MAVLFSQELGIETPYELHIKVKKLKGNKCGGIDNLGDNRFKILIDKRCKKPERVKVLAHEMTHLKQFRNGELKDIPPVEGISLCMWKGELHGMTGIPKDYYLSPWEMEARAMESWLEWCWYKRKK